MTTIAYKDGVIACDSRSTQGNTIISDNTNKIIKRYNGIFILSGAVCMHDTLISAFFEEIHEKFEHSVNGLAYHNNMLYALGYHFEEGFWKHTWDKKVMYTCGSGCDHALTAMDLGCSPKEAVKMAIKRDCNSGGKIREIKLW